MVQATEHVQKISYFRLTLEILWVVFVWIKAVIQKNLAKLIPRLGRPKLSFHDKVVLLTGAGGGFGRRLSERLAQRGAIIACVDVDSGANQRCVDAANNAAKEAGKGWNRAHAFGANLADREETQSIVREVEKKLGRIDVLISGAVCFTTYDALGFGDDEIDFLVDLNFKSTIWLTRAVLPGMRQRGFGHIAVLSSLASLSPQEGLTLYSACKSALNGYMMALYQELRKDPADIGVTIICSSISPTSPIVRELISSRLPYIDPDYAAEEMLKAIEDRDLNLVLPKFMGLVAVVPWIFPKEVLDYFHNVANVAIDFNIKLPRATITVDKWSVEKPVYGKSGQLILPHDGDEKTMSRTSDESRKSL